MKKYLLPETGNFYKANLHCHTTVSDGKLTPEEVKALYMRNGYSVVAFTDHDILIPHPELKDENFLPLNGYEVEINEPSNGREFKHLKTCHMCFISLDENNVRQVCWSGDRYLFGNSPKYIDIVEHGDEDYERVYSHEGVNEMIRIARENGFFVSYNHPHWSLQDYSDYIGYEGMNALEIANYGCIVAGFPDYVPEVYDDLLRAGKRIFCVASDDNHNEYNTDGPYSDSCGAFTVIKAEKLEYGDIARALELGHFYASQGPEIKELWYEDGKIHIVTSPARKISFNYGSRKAMSFYSSDEAPITEAVFDVPNDCGYVRVTVLDKNGKPANTNAYFADELER